MNKLLELFGSYTSTLTLGLGLVSCCISNSLSAQLEPTPVRNEMPLADQQEIIMMRHAYLDEGSYQYWYEQSLNGVWPWFERLGARILGDFEIIYPSSDDATPGQDEALRFARYASYEHWQATRSNVSAGNTGGSIRLAGNGGLNDAAVEALRNRRQVSQGSRGAIFLQGYLAQTRPLYMPGVVEEFTLLDDIKAPAADSMAPIPVRLGRAQPGEEVLGLEYRRIHKGSFETFHSITRDRVYPYLEKIGARPVGQWQVVYLPNSTAVESADYDELYTLVRYASMEHYTQVWTNAVALGGNGPDYVALLAAFDELNDLSLGASTEFMRGPLYGSLPLYAPGLTETYTLVP